MSGPALKPFSGYPLRGNRSTAYPSRLLFLDTETRVQSEGKYNVHRFSLGWTRFLIRSRDGGVSKDTWTLALSSKTLCQYMESLAIGKKTLYVYGHNLFYDLQVSTFFQHFARSGWKLSFIYDAGMSFILVIQKGNARIKCVSSTNYFDYSLKVLGADVGIAKLDVDPLKASHDELAKYCRVDVEILSAAILKYMSFCQEHETGAFRLTRASQSFAAYRHRFMDNPIYPHNDETVSALERSGYFGGRVECFRIGRQRGGPFSFYDVNSMYPSVMVANRFPSKLIRHDLQADSEALRRLCDSACIMAKVQIETDEPAYAYRLPDKVLFPVGRFTTTLCTEGYRRAFDSGHILKVIESSVYESHYLFRSYVNYFYPLKAQYKSSGNRIYTQIVKLFLNSLYGKFGQQEPEEEWFDMPSQIEPYRVDEIDLDTGARQTRFGMFGKVVIQYDSKDSPDSFVAVAAHVTEYSRFALWDILSAIGLKRCLYCDTDSVAIRSSDAALLDGLVSVKRIGALDLASTCQELVLYAPKDYECDGRRKTKGVPKTASLVGLHTYEYEQFCRLDTHMREGVDDRFLSRKSQKIVNPEYQKGTVLPDGSVNPYLIVEDEA